MKDKNGVEYVRYSSLKPGDLLRADGGFDCIDEAVHVEVFKDETGAFYVECAHGRHFLNSEESGRHFLNSGESDFLIGFYPT